MSDAARRSTERAAVTGSIPEQAAAVVSAVRSGEVSIGMVYLRAYAGCEVARAAYPLHDRGRDGCPQGYGPRECAGNWWEHESAMWAGGLAWFDYHLQVPSRAVQLASILPLVREAQRSMDEHAAAWVAGYDAESPAAQATKRAVDVAEDWIAAWRPWVWQTEMPTVMKELRMQQWARRTTPGMNVAAWVPTPRQVGMVPAKLHARHVERWSLDDCLRILMPIVGLSDREVSQRQRAALLSWADWPDHLRLAAPQVGA